MKAEGRVFKFGDNVDTDVIIPAYQFSYDGASNWHKPLQMEIPAVDPALPHKMQLKHFVKVVRREVEPVVTPADNVKTLTLLNAIKEAAETGQLVEL